MASVVVIGAGIAGLTCAWRLRRAGFDVEVLEKQDAPGGRMRSDVVGEFVLDHGAPLMTSGDRNLHGVARVLGIAERVRNISRDGSAVLRGGALHRDPLDSPAAFATSRLLSPGAKLRTLKLGVELIRHGRFLDPLRPHQAAQLEGESLADGLVRVVGDECFEHFLGPSYSNRFASEPAEISWPCALLALRARIEGRRHQTFQSGMGLLTRTLANRVRVRLGCEVTRVETETHGARIHYRMGDREGRVVADAVVVAVPGNRVVDLCVKLTPDERGFFESLRYTSGISVFLMLESAPPTLAYRCVVLPSSANLGLRGLVVDHHKPGFAPPGAGLIKAVLTSRAADRLWNASRSEVADCVIEALARTPIGRLPVQDCAVQRYAPMQPRFEPGALRRLAEFLQRLDRSPRMAFAGDYLIGSTAEAALTSGMRAASEISQL